MRYEKTQKGNPHALTIRQHVFPKKSIERFSGADGCVSVLLKRQGLRRLRPNNEIFCAMRAWDESAERGYMRKIENKYQRLVDRLLVGDLHCTHQDHKIITHMFVLWFLRFDFSVEPCGDIESDLVGTVIEKNHEEILEKNGYKYMRVDGIMPGRQIASIRIQMLIDRLLSPEIRWGIIKSELFEFCVPDTYGGLAMIPVNPKICFVAGKEDMVVHKDDVIQINKIALSNSINYVFARDFDHCPL